MRYRSAAPGTQAGPLASATARWVLAVTGLALLVLWGTAAGYLAYERERSIAAGEQQVEGAVTLLHAHATRTMESARASLAILDGWLSEEHFADRPRPLRLIGAVASRLPAVGGTIPDIRLFDETGAIFDIEAGAATISSVLPATLFEHLAGLAPGGIAIEAPFRSP